MPVALTMRLVAAYAQFPTSQVQHPEARTEHQPFGASPPKLMATVRSYMFVVAFFSHQGLITNIYD